MGGHASDPCLKGKVWRRWDVDEAFYFHLTLEPHHKHSGSITGGKILLLAEVSVDAAKKTARNPGDEDSLSQEAEGLAADLVPIAMTGRPRGEGEDVMRFSCHAIPRPSENLLGRSPDAEKDSVRLWLLGAKVE
jgi:hypothetical protein